jgi:hypothetical protein
MHLTSDAVDYLNKKFGMVQSGDQNVGLGNILEYLITSLGDQEKISSGYQVRAKADSFKPGQMDDDAEYVYRTLSHDLQALAKLVDQKADKGEFQMVTGVLEEEFSKAPSKEEFIESMTILSNNLAKAIDAIKAMSEKLDAENVTNLDKDYADVVNSKL